MGLSSIPWASPRSSEAVRELNEIGKAPFGTRIEIDEQRRQMIGIATLRQLSEGHRHHPFVGQTEALQDGHVTVVVQQQRQHADHVVEDSLGVDLSDQRRPTDRLQGSLVQGVTVENGCALHWIDHDPCPGEVGERHARNDVEWSVVVAAEERNGALSNDGAAGDGIDDIARRGGGNQTVDDRCVCLIEGGRTVVDLVKALPDHALSSELLCSRMSLGAKESTGLRGRFENGQRYGKDVLDPCGTQTDYLDHLVPRSVDSSGLATLASGRLESRRHQTRRCRRALRNARRCR